MRSAAFTLQDRSNYQLARAFTPLHSPTPACSAAIYPSRIRTCPNPVAGGPRAVSTAEMKSGRGQPHSTTCRTSHTVLPHRACVLECGCPLPLSFRRVHLNPSIQSHRRKTKNAGGHKFYTPATRYGVWAEASGSLTSPASPATRINSAPTSSIILMTPGPQNHRGLSSHHDQQRRG